MTSTYGAPPRPGTHRRAFSSQISGIVNGAIEEEPVLELRQISNEDRSSSNGSTKDRGASGRDATQVIEMDTRSNGDDNGVIITAPIKNGNTLDSNASGPGKKLKKKRNLPSSRGTVLSIVGFFLTGLMLILSAVIVLAVENHTAFRVASGLMLTLGALFISICIVLQQKNITKLSDTMRNDLFKLFSAKGNEFK